MANPIYAGPGSQNNQQDQTNPKNANPQKQVNRPDEAVSNEDENIVNTDEQNEVVNEQDTVNSGTAESADKEKAFEEGTRNDSLTEPEFRDSDDQLEFPEEEGK